MLTLTFGEGHPCENISRRCDIQCITAFIKTYLHLNNVLNNVTNTLTNTLPGITDFLWGKLEKFQKIEHFSIAFTTFCENPLKELHNCAYSLNLMDIEIDQAEDNIGKQYFTGFLYFFY